MRRRTSASFNPAAGRCWLPALLLLVAVSAGGCQTSVASWVSLFAGTNGLPTGSPPATGSTADATPTPDAGSSDYPVEQATIEDPDLTLTLPVRWTTTPIDTYRGMIVAARDALPATDRALYTDHLKKIDSGAVRLVASGPSGFEPWIGSMFFEVDSGDPSLDAALARVEKLMAANAPATTREQRHITFPFGECERIVTTHALTPDAPVGSVPARGIDYVIRLVDGRTLLIQAVGPEAAQCFDGMIDASVMTLAPS
jgi:hypothetical protein